MGSGILGSMGGVVFLLGRVRQETIRLGGTYGCDDYVYTIVLDVNQYGVFLYSMCNDIMRNHIRCLL